MKNFSFQKDGKTYWYSRAVVCVTAVFCVDRKNRPYVLANQRGTATDKEVGRWNMPVGFLDFDETCAQCAVREVFEETGVKISSNKVKLYNINSTPDSGSQDIGFRYYVKLNGFIDQYQPSLANMEKNEAVTAKWIALSEYNNYEWAWNHKELVEKFAKLVFGDAAFSSSCSEVRCMVKCPDGGKLEIFGTKTQYGNVDYVDYSTHCHNCKDSAENNFIKAYKRCIENFHKLTPLTKDAYILSLISKIK